MVKTRPDLPSLSGKQVADIRKVAEIAAAQAGDALSRLSKIPVSISDPDVANLVPGDVSALFGGLQTPAIGVLIPYQGDVEGGALLLFPDEGISELEKLLLVPSGKTDDSLKRSAFAEVANILTGTFLTVLSSLSERIIISLPPIVVQDMAGAILDSILAEVGTWSDEVTTLVFKLTGPDGASLVNAVLIPGSSGIELLLEAAGRLKSGS